MDLTKEEILTRSPIIVTEYIEELLKEALGESLAKAVELKSYQGWWVFNFPFNQMNRIKIYKELTWWNDCKVRRRQVVIIINKLKAIKKLKEEGYNIRHV